LIDAFRAHDVLNALDEAAEKARKEAKENV
jgi:hypothetical protein